MLIFVYFALALLALGEALQPNYGPHVFAQSLPAPPQEEIRFYLTPNGIKAIQDTQDIKISTEKSPSLKEAEQSILQKYNDEQQQQLNQYTKQSELSEPQGEFRGLWSPSSVHYKQKPNDVAQISDNLDFNRQFTLQNSNDGQQQQLSQNIKLSNIQEEFSELPSESLSYLERQQSNNFNKQLSQQNSAGLQQQRQLNQYIKLSNDQEPKGEFRGLLSPSSLYFKGQQNDNVNYNKQSSLQNADERQQRQLNQYIKLSNDQEPKGEFRGLLSPSSLYFKGQQSDNVNYNKQSSLQNSDERQQQQLNQYKQSSNSQKFQEEFPALLSPSSIFYKGKSSFENQQANNYDLNNFYLKLRNQAAESLSIQKNQKIETQKGSDAQKQSEWKPFSPATVKSEEETILHEQLQQHWNRILYHNRSQLKALNENAKQAREAAKSVEQKPSNTQIKDQKTETDKQIELIMKNILTSSLSDEQKLNIEKQMQVILTNLESNEKQMKNILENMQSNAFKEKQNIEGEKQMEAILKNMQSNSLKNGQNVEAEKEIENILKTMLSNSLKNNEKSDVEKQIENILKHDEAFELEKQKALAQARAANERPPIIIHKEVSVTKHLPIFKHVKVEVPTPVLVPVPEPFEVKVPHPYPVPLEVVKHIPVPVVRNH